LIRDRVWKSGWLSYDRVLKSLVDFGWQELEEVGGTEELEKEIQKRIKRRETLDAMQ
jgi:hypothetical protein